MTGIAILSFDCEGKWGVADHLTGAHARELCDARLRSAYQGIVSLLDAYSTPATFAFVGLFAQSPEALRAFPLDELARDLPYLRAAAEGVKSGDEGWSGAWAVDLIGPGHELAFHGMTHVPWPELSTAQAQAELEFAPPHMRQTLVFPRNKVAHLDVLQRCGCLGYRSARPAQARWASLASEFNVNPASEAAAAGETPLKIAAGIFINWRNGLRAAVSPAITRLRARRLLRHAAQNDGVAHFWIHPENIASRPSTMENLKAVVQEIAAARDAGRIRVET